MILACTGVLNARPRTAAISFSSTRKRASSSFGASARVGHVEKTSVEIDNRENSKIRVDMKASWWGATRTQSCHLTGHVLQSASRRPVIGQRLHADAAKDAGEQPLERIDDQAAQRADPWHDGAQPESDEQP